MKNWHWIWLGWAMASLWAAITFMDETSDGEPVQALLAGIAAVLHAWIAVALARDVRRFMREEVDQ